MFHPRLRSAESSSSRRPGKLAGDLGPCRAPYADNMEMAKADVGDLIVVLQSGAYGLTASPTAFLSHPAPAELLV